VTPDRPAWPQPPLTAKRLYLSVLGVSWALLCVVAGSYPAWRLPAALLASAGVALAGAVLATGSSLGLFSPFLLFVISGLLYSVPTGLTLLLHGTLVADRPFNEAEMRNAAWVTACALTAATAAYAVLRGVRLQARPFGRFLSRYEPVSAAVVAWVLIGSGALALAVLLVRVGGPGALAGARYGERYRMLRGLGPLLMGLQACTVGGGMLYLGALRRGNARRAALILLLLLGGLALWTSLMESRAALVQAMVLLLVIRQTSRRPLRTATVVALATSLVLLGIYVSLRRGTPRGIQIRVAEVPGWLYNPANTEFGAAQVTVADITAAVPARVGYRYGGTYLSAAAVAVPSLLWPGRPLATGEWYASDFYPGVWEVGGAFAFSPVAEAWLNLGMAGVWLAFAVIGAALAWLERKLLQYEQLPGWVSLAFGLAAPFLITFFRLDLASLLKGYLLVTCLPLLAALLAAHLLEGALLHRPVRALPA
jgi:hypothetical protein